MEVADGDGSGNVSREELRDAVRKITNGGVTGASSAAGAIERAFDDWLRETFLPAALRAMQKKKMGVK